MSALLVTILSLATASPDPLFLGPHVTDSRLTGSVDLVVSVVLECPIQCTGQKPAPDKSHFLPSPNY